MSDIERPREGDFEMANAQLNDGLKSCRSVLNNYRSLLAPEQHLHVANDDSAVEEREEFLRTADD